MKWTAALFVSTTLLGVSVSVSAAEVRPLEVRLRVENERVTADFSVAPAVDDEFRRRVDGGLESRVEIATRLLDARGETVGRGGRTCKLLYSLWDEQVFLTLKDDDQPRARVFVFDTVEPAIAACVEVAGLSVGLAGALSLAKGYRLQVRVVLNPVSEDMVERSRQFITNPRGGARARPNAVLGAVAELFGGWEGALGGVSAFVSPPLSRPAAGDARRVAGTSTGAAGKDGAAP